MAFFLSHKNIAKEKGGGGWGKKKEKKGHSTTYSRKYAHIYHM